MGGTKSYLIKNKKERLLVNIALGVLSLALITVGLLIFTNIFDLSSVNSKTLTEFKKLMGNIALIAFAISFALYAIRWLMKLSFLKDLKKYIIVVLKYVRQFHAPIALVGGALVSIHAYLMLRNGLKFNVTYITGLIALILIGVQLIAGFLRYKKIGIKFHRVLGIVTILAMVSHWLLT